MKRSLAAATALAFAFGCIGSAQAQDFGKAIKGAIVFDGTKPPEPDELNVDKDKMACLKNGTVKLFSKDWLVNKKNLGIKHVFIWLEPEKEGDPMPIHPDLKDIKKKEVMIDQPCCLFEPECLVLREGQVLVVKNSAEISHNFKWGGHPKTNPGGNVSIIPNGMYKIEGKELLKADPNFPVAVECTIHGWMKGWIRVFDHPYFALTDENGKFDIPSPPAGKYRLKVWHPGSGWLGGPPGKAGKLINIQAGEVFDAGTMKIEKKS